MIAIGAIGLTGCGADTEASPDDPVALAAKATVAKPMRVELLGRVAVAGNTLWTRGTGFSDASRHLTSMTIDMGNKESETPLVEMESVVDGTEMYMKSDLFSSELPDGRTWMKLDLAKIGDKLDMDMNKALSQSSTDALAMLARLADVQRVGDETLAGATVTHYRGHVDKSLISDKLREAGDPSYGPVDIWVDADGLVRRTTTSMSMKVADSGERTSMTNDMRFSAFGEPVTIVVPDEDEVFDATSMTVAGLGG